MRVLAILVAVLLGAAAIASAATGGTDEREKGNVKQSQREYLFVQNARRGSFVPVAGHPGRYRLTLTNVDPHALYFSDRPARQTGVMGQDALLGALFGKGTPAPNAAITIARGKEDADVLAVELSSPRYDAKRHTLRYAARRLTQAPHGLTHLDDRLDRALPRRFGAVTLFIDDGTSFGNSCAANVANSTDGTIVVTSASNWSTDTWDTDPSGEGLPNDGKFYGAGSDHGGAFRGCSFTTQWLMPDGSSMTIQTSDPESGSNTFTCTPSNPGRYSCALDSSSTIHGPILLTYWKVTKN